jgi:hypothetical protein
MFLNPVYFVLKFSKRTTYVHFSHSVPLWDVECNRLGCRDPWLVGVGYQQDCRSFRYFHTPQKHVHHELYAGHACSDGSTLVGRGQLLWICDDNDAATVSYTQRAAGVCLSYRAFTGNISDSARKQHLFAVLLGQVTWTSAKRHGSLGFELASHPFLLLVSASPVDYLEPRYNIYYSLHLYKSMSETLAKFGCI